MKKAKEHFHCDLLVFAPHPDDAELFCGGIILGAVAAGRKVVLIDLSRGELSSRGNLDTRAKETEAATAILGIASRENLELPDGSIGFGVVDQRKHVVSALRRHRPEVVLIPYSEERHPDHVRSNGLLVESIFFAGVEKFFVDHKSPAHVPRAVYSYQLRHGFRPSLIVDVTAVHSKKIEAVKCYCSQLGLGTEAGPATLLSSPLSLSSIIARDGYFGGMIGAQYGEPLYSLAVPGTADLVDFARRAQREPALFF
jgi:bacillithiol biosynthesis deacetylase BshB1